MTILGSKNKYSKYIVPIIQKTIDENNITTFVDCCCGGCNIIKNIKCPTRIAIDNNEFLIALWQKMQEDDFVFPDKPTRADWDQAKTGNSNLEKWYIGLTEIFASYNTRGFAGGFIHGAIGEKQYNGRVNTAIKDIPQIKDVIFKCADYSTLLTYTNCVIYVDPPYYGTKKYDTSKNFNYENFWDVIRKISNNNFVYVSEETAPEDFVPIWSLESNRQLGGKKSPCIEHLFVYNKREI